MTEQLIIRTASGDFDLFGNDDIVQTFSVFNFEDITSRSGEYTNLFDLPLTNNNLSIIESCNVIITVNTFPYKKTPCDILVDGSFFRTGFIVIDSIGSTIKAKFFSGNTNFFFVLKSYTLQDLDWSDLDHIWGYTEALYACNNNLDYFYPVMDYNNQTLAGDILDIRKVLPATKAISIIERMFEKVGYTIDLNSFGSSTINKMCVPYSNNNPTISAQTQLFNSVDVQIASNYTLQDQLNFTFRVFFPGYPSNQTLGSYNTSTSLKLNFNQIVTTGSSLNFDFSTQRFTSLYSGTYDFDCVAALVNYDTISVNTYPPIGSYDANTYTSIVCYKTSGGVKSAVKSQVCATGTKSEAYTGSGAFTTISGLTQTYTTDTLTGSVYMIAGDFLEFELKTVYDIRGVSLGAGGPYYTDYTNMQVNVSSQVQAISTLQIDLQPELVFGGLITYSSILPKISCAAFLRDICIREGIILNVDEDSKTVVPSRIEDIYANIPIAYDWSDKVDDNSVDQISFKFDNYGQNNYFKHKEDKSVLSKNPGADYNLTINNDNIIKDKVIYESPFSETETRVFNGYNVAYISLYNISDDKFNYNINHRILYFKDVLIDFKITDGTSTSAYVNTRVAYFIDDSDLTYAMGFGTNLIPKNSKPLIDILQNTKRLKKDFNLSIIDIKSINYMIPVYIEKYQSYFFISSINQFNYTNPQSTEVDLIKLNP